jgi:hypothetical protein
MAIGLRSRNRVDELLERYIDWRYECDYVAVAYRDWCGAAPDERPLAFAVYEAALEREKAACDGYADLVSLLRSGRTAVGAHGV